MKITSEVLISKVELKQSKEGKAYLMVSFMDMQDGSTFDVIEKDIEYMQKLQQFKKYKISLDLSNSKYGLSLKLDKVLDELGSI